jgi:hypothetical protein
VGAGLPERWVVVVVRAGFLKDLGWGKLAIGHDCT